jgi:hypothetical protein
VPKLIEHARVGDVVEIVAGTRRERAIRAEAGDRAVDEARVRFAQHVVTHAEARHDAWPETFHEYVGVARQVDQRRAAVGAFQVEHALALAPVQLPIERARDARGAVGFALQDRARVVAFAGRLDFQDIRAEFREPHRRERTGQ